MGASGGIGRAVALALAAEGVSVFLAARRQEGLEAVAKTIRETSPAVRTWVCPTDLSRDEDAERLRVTVEREAGGLDVLVHSAGSYERGPIQEATSEQFDALFRANVRGVFLLTKAFLSMLKARKGQVVFMNSSSGLKARPLAGPFSATQHAMRAVADSLRDEVNGEGVRVLNMYLGRTATPRMERIYDHDAKAYRPELLMQPEDVAAMAIAALRQPRSAEVTEIHMRPMVASY
jgi:NADP-dependent 3-hydroxy acid dehydrogenase YdfG